MLASSSAASISSSMQKGVGLRSSMANSMAMAVSARSPPESSESICSFLPGGWATMSMPQFSASFGSASRSSALPPPNSFTNVRWKLSFISANWLLNCFSIWVSRSATMPSRSAWAFSRSSRWLDSSSTRSTVRRYSSSAATFTVPIARMRWRMAVMRFSDSVSLKSAWRKGSAPA